LAVPLFAAVDRAYRSPNESESTRAALRSLVTHLGRHGDLLSNEQAVTALGYRPGNTYLEGVLALARHADRWIRSPETWRPRTHNVRRQFGALARHLSAEWPVPSFLDAAWFQGGGDEAVRRQGWFLHIGRGENIRHADLPVPLTKRMAHHFLEAPADLSIEGALRWGQILALGGDERLVRALLGTHLERALEHDEFWLSVFRWFIEHPLLSKDRVGPILDFIRHQKFGEPDGGEPVPQPNFSMKGRSPETLLAQVDGWHRRLSAADLAPAEWPASGIRGFRFLEGSKEGRNLRIWTIRELLNSKALSSEGRAMRHCVGSYSRACARGTSSIWTMEVDEREGLRKVLTIEVDPRHRNICQVRCKLNNLPDERSRGLVRRWAAEAGLAMAGRF
jgi:hypothetical protein